MQNFKDEDGKIIAEEEEIRFMVPNQISEAEGAAVAAAGAAASAAVGASGAIQISLQFILKGSMNQMLSSIKHLQIIVHLCIMNLIVPATT